MGSPLLIHCDIAPAYPTVNYSRAASYSAMLAIMRRRIRIASSSRPVFIMDRNLLVAVAHFPDRGHAIEELAKTNEGFCSLCTDLAEAKAALLRWEQSPSPVREARTIEYRGLMNELAAEVEATLDRYR